jgi:hypothetical protein
MGRGLRQACPLGPGPNAQEPIWDIFVFIWPGHRTHLGSLGPGLFGPIGLGTWADLDFVGRVLSHLEPLGGRPGRIWAQFV